MENVWLNPQHAQAKPTTAIFADRDGTLIRHVDYIGKPEEVELLPGVKDAVQMLLKQEIPLFIFTNQSGVGRGYFPIENVHACQYRLFELLGVEPTDIGGWCIAPEAPGTEGGYRKPSPRFLNEACEHLGIGPECCHIIGDTLVDLETAWNCGAQAWGVTCGKPDMRIASENGSIAGGEYQIRDDFHTCIQSILNKSN